MCTKYLIALFLLVLTVQGVQVSVGDSEVFRGSAFSSIVKLSNLAIN